MPWPSGSILGLVGGGSLLAVLGSLMFLFTYIVQYEREQNEVMQALLKK